MTTKHFVATTFCVSDKKVLLVYHKKLDMWLPPGGHINENELPCQAAVREFKEETGLDISLHGKEENLDHDVKKLIQPNHIQLEDIEEGHQHIDLIYFAKLINPSQSISIQKTEVDDGRWFSEEELHDDIIKENVRNIAKLAMKKLEEK